ncbi:CD48 antigen-like [Apteryx mantelli]|uniref:CD48 antigen-like n=1 Tax=Apteryx mantelli TaxID=2696672 RepID=A0ABM4FWC5_9AVES
MVFLFLLQQAAAQGGPSRVAGIVGGTAYLHPAPRNRTTFHQVHWRYETSQKIAIREADGSIRYPDSRFKDRLRLFPNNTLQIRSLRKSDRGVYWLYLEEETGTEHTDSVLLAVYERVPKPTVTAEVEGGDAAHCQATLTCSVDLEDVTYEWILPQRQPPESRGSELHLSFRPGVETYVCRVSNAVSASNASLTYRHPCSWQAESSAVSVAQNTKILLALAFLLFLLLLA